MKKLLLLLVLGGSVAGATAQNLLPNPGFQQRSACPNAQGQIANVIGWNNYTLRTPDYYNNCDNSFYFSVPMNIWGHQSQQTAAPEEAYAGMYTQFPGSTPNAKEYMHCRIPALQVGQMYEMSMHVSMGDDSRVATDGLGVHFFVAGDSFLNTNDPVYTTPKVSYDSYGILSNKSSWMKLSKTFIADSAYTHLVIGCFKNDTLLNKTVINASSDFIAYYYIDDLELKLIPAGSVNTQMLMQDITLYPNPSAGVLNITLPQFIAGNASLTVYSMVGQKLFETGIASGNNSLQLPAGISSGTYLAAIKTEAGVRSIPFTLQR